MSKPMMAAVQKPKVDLEAPTQIVQHRCPKCHGINLTMKNCCWQEWDGAHYYGEIEVTDRYVNDPGQTDPTMICRCGWMGLYEELEAKLEGKGERWRKVRNISQRLWVP